MKTEIKNRNGLKIAINLFLSKNPIGIAIIMHGLGGFKEQLHIEAIANTCIEKGYTTITFDTTNSIGESGGVFEDATITTYYHDLADVVSWAEKQKWFTEPLILAGHSLGGFSVAFYAENYPSKVFAVAPISPLVSGSLSVVAHRTYELEDFVKWEKTGWQIKESTSKPGVIKRLPWSHMADRMQYDLIPKVDKLKMPVLLIVGEKDTATPANHVKILYDKIPGLQKELRVIGNAPHTFRSDADIAEVKKLFSTWLAKIAES